MTQVRTCPGVSKGDWREVVVGWVSLEEDTDDVQQCFVIREQKKTGGDLRLWGRQNVRGMAREGAQGTGSAGKS